MKDIDLTKEFTLDGIKLTNLHILHAKRELEGWREVEELCQKLYDKWKSLKEHYGGPGSIQRLESTLHGLQEAQRSVLAKEASLESLISTRDALQRLSDSLVEMPEATFDDDSTDSLN